MCKNRMTKYVFSFHRNVIAQLFLFFYIYILNNDFEIVYGNSGIKYCNLEEKFTFFSNYKTDSSTQFKSKLYIRIFTSNNIIFII